MLQWLILISALCCTTRDMTADDGGNFMPNERQPFGCGFPFLAACFEYWCACEINDDPKWHIYCPGSCTLHLCCYAWVCYTWMCRGCQDFNEPQPDEPLGNYRCTCFGASCGPTCKYCIPPRLDDKVFANVDQWGCGCTPVCCPAFKSTN